eukprot:TRINITY_DN3171_c1_g1_i5.p2 TRINITY_DN3171_c1_g1~~TRINITY_DN3171_c1_g1_i5.p2  ORF type:complete len:234 (-),score=32.83 TRINITY_DN3171_c1_g1_i5:93-794(-)
MSPPMPPPPNIHLVNGNDQLQAEPPILPRKELMVVREVKRRKRGPQVIEPQYQLLRDSAQPDAHLYKIIEQIKVTCVLFPSTLPPEELQQLNQHWKDVALQLLIRLRDYLPTKTCPWGTNEDTFTWIASFVGFDPRIYNTHPDLYEATLKRLVKFFCCLLPLPEGEIRNRIVHSMSNWKSLDRDDPEKFQKKFRSTIYFTHWDPWPENTQQHADRPINFGRELVPYISLVWDQ